MIKVQSKIELMQIIKKRKIKLEEVDVSDIDDMSYLFVDIEKMNGSIANWDANERIINNSLLIVNEDKR